MNHYFAAGDLVEFGVADLILSLDDRRRWAWVRGGHLLSPFGVKESLWSMLYMDWIGAGAA
jgi:hypothetical protein